MTTLTETKPTTARGDDPYQHARYALGNAGVRTWPYPHMHVSGVFPEWYYAELLAHFPPLDAMHALSERYPKRRTLTISEPEQVATLPDPARSFWSAFAHRFGSPEMLDFVVRTYDPLLADRFKGRLAPMIHLFADVGGYGIGPHADTQKKLLTQLFYLPDDDTMSSAGTSVLVKTDNAAPRPHHLHDWSGYESAFTAPFAPNSMLSFIVTPDSHHGVRATEPGTVRRSLQFFVMQKEN